MGPHDSQRRGDAVSRPPALVFGVPITNVTMDEALDLIGELVDHGRRTGRTHQIATVNVDFLVNAIDEPDLLSILQGAEVCLADGAPVVWAASLLGVPLRERVAGSDLVPLLARESVTRGWRVHVLGSSSHVAEHALEKLQERHPGCRVSIDPGPTIADPDDVDDGIVDGIVALDPDILCVALGNPKQERFIRAYRERLGTPVLIGVGGSLDMYVGERRRAPVWVQRIGMEWVVRALQEPKRLGRRYAHDIVVFGPRLVRERRAVRRLRLSGGIALAVETKNVRAQVGVAGLPDTATWSEAMNRLDAGLPLRLVCEPSGSVSHRAIAMLVGLVQRARLMGGTVEWERQPGPVVVEDFRLASVSSEMVGLESHWRVDEA